MRTVVVTGAGGALGGAVAEELTARGCSLALLDTGRATARLSEWVSRGKSSAIVCEVDAASETSLSAAWRETETRFGDVDGAVLCVGGYAGGQFVHSGTEDDPLEAMLRMNLQTVYRALRVMLPAMVARKRGSVVVVGARAAVQPWTSAGAAAYAASKAAAVAMVQSVAEEVGAAGVRVNAILPGTMDTPANRHAMPDADFSRWVALPDVAKLIAFLLSADAAGVNGASVPIYGKS